MFLVVAVCNIALYIVAVVMVLPWLMRIVAVENLLQVRPVILRRVDQYVSMIILIMFVEILVQIHLNGITIVGMSESATKTTYIAMDTREAQATVQSQVHMK